MVSSRRSKGIGLFKLKLPAFTIVEGVVSMLILSIILSIGAIISFNLYRAFPPYRILTFESMAQLKMDSIMERGIIEAKQWSDRGISYSLDVNPFYDMEHVYVARLSVADSFGNSCLIQDISYAFDKAED